MTISKTKFTKAFKLEALQLANQPNTCIASLARDLGIRRNMIYSFQYPLEGYKWREQLNKKQDEHLKEPLIMLTHRTIKQHILNY